MALRTSIHLLFLFFAFPLLSQQTPVTHVVTKTISAGDLGAAVFPTETPTAVPSGVVEITIPAIPMTPGSTVTITTVITIDDPSAVEAHRQGYTWRLYKKFLDALPKPEPPKGKPAAPPNQEKQDKKEKQQQKKPTEQPKNVGESSNKKTEQANKPSDPPTAERQAQHERELNRIASLPPPPGPPVPQPKPEPSSSTSTPNRKKSVSFSVPEGGDGGYRGSGGSDRSRGSRVTVNIV
ncbi:hypothetical protein FQN54_003928 [Arachnomyces sp. PD_36]|nr:hypothetical protein FQN54_003928 [Arachnomyces sp. PD_36]